MSLSSLARIPRLLGAGAAASLLFISLSAAAAGNSIRIGQAIDLSGPNGSIGRDYVAGIKTCFDMINSRGGINGRKIEYTARDDGGQPARSARAASELLENDGVDYLLGGIGDDATRAVLDSAAFRRSGKALFSPLAAGDYPPSSHALFWRPAYRQEIDFLFSYFSKLGLTNVGIVYQDTPFNLNAYRSLSAEIEKRHMTLAGTARIGSDGSRAAAEAQRLAAARPGFVLMLADTIGSALFLKEFRKHDAQTMVAGSSLTNLETLRELAGPNAVEWTLFAQVVPNPNAGASLLQIQHLDMMRKFRDEAVSSLTLEGFAAATALVKAIEAKRSGYAQLHDFFAQGTDIDLGGLAVAVTANGNRLSTYMDIAMMRKGSGLMF